MDFEAWLKKNEPLIDWSLFFRQEQIEAIVHSSRVLQKESPVVLDLGCGPGILGKLLTDQKPTTQYFGVDGDPLMLSSMKHLLSGRNITALQHNLRKAEWSQQFRGHFDSVISLTALHWLSQEHQNEIYKSAYKVLKPGGTFSIGDPYKPEDPQERKELEELHYKYSATQSGQTWEEFWQNFFDKYSMKEMYTEYHAKKGYQIPFEGSDEGYTLSSHLKALKGAGFSDVSVFWKADLRAVYGGTK